MAKAALRLKYRKMKTTPNYLNVRYAVFVDMDIELELGATIEEISKWMLSDKYADGEFSKEDIKAAIREYIAQDNL